MNSITKISWNNNLISEESFKIVDRAENYEIFFRSINGYERSEIIRKDSLLNENGEPNIHTHPGIIANVLFINTETLKKARRHWIDEVKNYRTKNDVRKWLLFSYS